VNLEVRRAKILGNETHLITPTKFSHKIPIDDSYDMIALDGNYILVGEY